MTDYVEPIYDDEEEDDILSYGLEYIKYMFEGCKNFQELGDELIAAGQHFRGLDKDYKMVDPVDNAYVHFVRRDGRDVYVEENNVLSFAKYED